MIDIDEFGWIIQNPTKNICSIVSCLNASYFMEKDFDVFEKCKEICNKTNIKKYKGNHQTLFVSAWLCDLSLNFLSKDLNKVKNHLDKNLPVIMSGKLNIDENKYKSELYVANEMLTEVYKTPTKIDFTKNNHSWCVIDYKKNKFLCTNVLFNTMWIYEDDFIINSGYGYFAVNDFVKENP